MGQLAARLTDFARRHRLVRHPRLIRVKHVATRTDLPDPLPRRRLVVIGDPAKWAVLACPCGTGHDINLNLVDERLARWTVLTKAPPSLTPSVDVQDPAGRCHFWLRNGRIVWVQSPRSPTPRAPTPT